MESLIQVCLNGFAVKLPFNTGGLLNRGGHYDRFDCISK